MEGGTKMRLLARGHSKDKVRLQQSHALCS